MTARSCRGRRKARGHRPRLQFPPMPASRTVILSLGEIMSPAYFWTIVVYMVLLVGIGAVRSRSVENQEDFSVAGRQLSTFVLFGIILLSFLAGRARRFPAITVQDILETRYNKWARVFGVVTLVLTAVTIVSY